MFGYYFKILYSWLYEKIRLYGCVHGFSTDFDSTDADDISDIHKYFMKKYDTKWYLDLLKIVH